MPAIGAGQRFSIALAVDGDPRRVEAIERRVVTSDIGWPSEAVVTKVSALARTKSGGFMIPFRPVERASTTTLQFVAIDRNGTHGPARRATLVVAADAAVSPAAAAAAEASAPRIECTPSTCGVVAAQREVELRTGETTYETTVRMDDRTILTITQSSQWPVGTRLHMGRDRVTAIDN